MIAEVKSINTQVEYRDNDMRSSNWFDADKFPTLTFKSTSFTKANGNNYKLKGTLTAGRLRQRKTQPALPQKEKLTAAITILAKLPH